MKQYTAVIFDLDGTLLDTLDDLTDAVNDTLQKHGFPTESKEHIRMALGNGIVSLFEAFVPHGQQNARFGCCLDHFRAVYPQMSQNHTKPYAGIPEMLSVLEENGIVTAVVSNKFHDAAKALVMQYFPSVSCSMGEQESLGIRRKPAPDMIFRIMQEYSIPAEQCLYVGDSEVDIETAENAGIDCVSVTWGLRDSAFLQDRGATLLIHTPDALTQYLLQHIKPYKE